MPSVQIILECAPAPPKKNQSIFNQLNLLHGPSDGRQEVGQT